MASIRGLATANCGEIVTINNVEDPIVTGEPIIVEVLRPEKHNPTHQIVCYYYFDKKLNSKVEVTLYRDITNGNIGSEVYFFKGNNIQHYKSANYVKLNYMPMKYANIITQLNKALNSVF